MSEDTTKPKTIADQLAEARQRKEEHDKKLDEKAMADELEFIELEERFEKELSGRHGAQFAIVNLTDVDEGYVVLKLGSAVFHKQFETALAKLKDGQKLDEVALDQYVTPSVVHPPTEAFRALCGRRYAMWGRCANALAGLHGVKKETDQGKF